MEARPAAPPRRVKLSARGGTGAGQKRSPPSPDAVDETTPQAEMCTETTFRHPGTKADMAGYVRSRVQCPRVVIDETVPGIGRVPGLGRVATLSRELDILERRQDDTPCSCCSHAIPAMIHSGFSAPIVKGTFQACLSESTHPPLACRAHRFFGPDFVRGLSPCSARRPLLRFCRPNVIGQPRTRCCEFTHRRR